jgi:ribosomal protein S18 acetylase RimI-like enzyme
VGRFTEYVEQKHEWLRWGYCLIDKLRLKLNMWRRSRFILAIRYIMRRIGFKYAKMVEFVRPLDAPIPIIYTKIRVEIKPFLAKDAREKNYDGICFTSGDNSSSHDKTLSRVISGRDTCLVALVNGEVAGYVWLLLKGTNYEPAIEIEETFEDSEGLLYQLNVFANFREKYIASKLIREGLCYLRSKGYSKCYSYVESGNMPSIKSFVKTNFYPVRIITCLRILNYKQTKQILVTKNYTRMAKKCS